MAGAALRFSLALWLIAQVVGTPIHLYLEPHCDPADVTPHATEPHGPASLWHDGADGHDGHERHSAAQHDLKALRTLRAPVAELAIVTVTECLDPEKGRPDEPVLECSGLSPPELPRSWQFVFRAALPVRAPSLAS